MGGQVIAVAFVEPQVERPRQPAGLDLLGEQQRIGERNPVAENGVLNRELLGVENETAIDRKIGTAERAALACFNETILREAVAARFNVIDLRLGV